MIVQLLAWLTVMTAAVASSGHLQSPDTDFCAPGRVAEDRNNLTLRVRVMYPDAGDQRLFLGGRYLWLGEGPQLELRRAGVDTYVYDFVYSNSPAGYACSNCQLDNVIAAEESLLLVVYRQDGGSITRMLGPAHRVRFPVSMASAEFAEPPEVLMAPNFDAVNGTSRTFVYQHPVLGERRVMLYLPPGLANPYRSVPLTVMLDLGPDLLSFYQSSFDAFFTSGGNVETAFLGFGDWKSATAEEYNEDRSKYLTPSPGQICRCKQGSLLDLCGGCIDESDEVGSFIRCCDMTTVGGYGDVLLDWLEELVADVSAVGAPGRLDTDRDQLGIMGYSLGGLLSCHAAWTRSHVYGRAACQSSSFWWPQQFNETGGGDRFDFLNVTLRAEQYRVDRHPQRLVIDVGGGEVTELNNIVEAGREVYNLMAEVPEFVGSKNLWYQVYPGKAHSYTAWIERMWNTLRILLN